MPQTKVGNVQIEWSESGIASNPLVLLIAGMGAQLTMWPQALMDRIAAAGFRVVCFDNRDIGLSSGFEHVASDAAVRAAFGGEGPLPIAYGVADMAADALGLMDALGARRAHVVGMSMGGVIGQLMAIRHPERVASFVQISSTTGEPHLPGSDPRIGAFFASAGAQIPERTVAIDRAVEFLKLLAGPTGARTDAQLRADATRDHDRNQHPDGALRQMVAVMTEPPRGAALASLTVSTLVIHGTDDLMVPLAAGEDTASRIPGARLDVVAGMGHSVEPGLSERLATSILDHLARAD